MLKNVRTFEKANIHFSRERYNATLVKVYFNLNFRMRCSQKIFYIFFHKKKL